MRRTSIHNVTLAAAILALAALPAGLLAQSYSPMYPPGGQWQEYIVCLDQNNQPIPYATIELIPGVYVYTNAHFHDDPSHPFSSVNPDFGYTDASGRFAYTFSTTLIGQAEFIYVGCSAAGGDLWTQFDHAVGYNDVYYNDHPEIWHRIGGTDTGANTGHGSTYYNRYMMTNAAYGLYYATQDYLAEHPGQQKVCTNDMALPFGGKFDIGRNWRSPHSSHDRGTAADVAGSSPQCPDEYEVTDLTGFVQKCVQRGALAAHSFVEGGHAHCNWMSPYSYPH